MAEIPDNPVKGAAERPPEAQFASPVQGRAADDDRLLDRVRARDQRAMTDLFDRYGRMVYSVALRVLKDPGNAEDVMQDVFFNLW